MTLARNLENGHLKEINVCVLESRVGVVNEMNLNSPSTW